jgi:hypothetical protein
VHLNRDIRMLQSLEVHSYPRKLTRLVPEGVDCRGQPRSKIAAKAGFGGSTQPRRWVKSEDPLGMQGLPVIVGKI